MPSSIDNTNTKLDVDKRLNEIEKKRNEEIKNLKKSMEKMDRKLNFLMNCIFQIKECDEETEILVLKIKTQVEKIIKRELPIYEPVGFKNELKDGKENYVIKVYIGEKNYIHISEQVEAQKKDIIELKVFSDKKFNDQL